MNTIKPIEGETRETILAYPQQQKIALILKTLHKVNKILDGLPQMNQQDLEIGNITHGQKQRLFKLYTLTDASLLKTITLEENNIDL